MRRTTALALVALLCSTPAFASKVLDNPTYEVSKSPSSGKTASANKVLDNPTYELIVRLLSALK